jgi:hypothetical protein
MIIPHSLFSKYFVFIEKMIRIFYYESKQKNYEMQDQIDNRVNKLMFISKYVFDVGKSPRYGIE